MNTRRPDPPRRPAASVVIGERLRTPAPGWVCPVTLDGVEHEVGAVVISGGATPTPRVFAWVARRQDLTVKKVWEGEVSAASGPRDVLLLAGMVT